MTPPLAAADTKKPPPAAPPPRAAAPPPSAPRATGPQMAAPGARMPGAPMGAGQAGAAHLPGSMAGAGAGAGAHIPGSMNAGAYPAAGGAHVPGSIAAPGAAGGARMPGSVASEAHGPAAGGARPSAAFAQAHPAFEAAHAPAPGAAREPGPGEGARAGEGAAARREGDPRIAAPERGGVEHAAFEHGGGPRDYGRPATGLAGRDARLAPEAGLHTRGVEAAMAERHEARPFLRPEEHRDVMRDRAFIGRHEGDFHTRNVRDFSAREMHAWRRGLWRNEWHYGRRGWWWDVDDVYYGYPEPLWPYPAEVAVLTAYDTDVVDDPALQQLDESGGSAAEEGTQYAAFPDAQPDPGIDPGASPGAPQRTAPPRPRAALAAIAPLPAPPGGSYYCADPAGYFPATALCAAPWDLVRDAPPGDR